MAGREPVLHYEETQAEKFARKSKESPFMIIGLVGLVAACGIGAYKFKHRGAMSTSVFLMQLRVLAQGTVVGSLTIGLVYNMARDHIFKRNDK